MQRHDITKRKPRISGDDLQLLHAALAAVSGGRIKRGSAFRLAGALGVSHTKIARWQSGGCRITHGWKILLRMVVAGHLDLVREAVLA